MKIKHWYLWAITSLAVAAQTYGTLPTGWEANRFPAWKSPVSSEAIKIEGKTDIVWVPEPYTFKTGEAVRYIDYKDGDDNNSGASPEEAWKHHPWDANASAEAAKAAGGVDTYVFKGGVTYYGKLLGKASGEAGKPIRLTWDPTWGEGKAILSGSELIGAKWQPLKAAEAERLGIKPNVVPNIWVADLTLDYKPTAMWLWQQAGPQRQVLARWPNWKIEERYNHFTQWLRAEKVQPGHPWTTIQAKALVGFPKEAFDGATIWIDHPNDHGNFTIQGPVPSRTSAYNPDDGTIRLELAHPRRRPTENSPFFLENKAWFIDEAGEWFYDENRARLYYWPPNGINPATAQVELARHQSIIELEDTQHIEISGLTFTGGNSIDLNSAVDFQGHTRPETRSEMPAILLRGNCQHIDMHHLEITETAGGGIANLVTHAQDVVSNINVSDSRFTHIDNDAIYLTRGFSYRKTEAQPKARLTKVILYRNYLEDIGFRGSALSTAGKAIDLNGPEIADVAGNVIQWVAAHGINIQGGRPTGGWMGTDAPETPLVRIQVRHNKVKDALLYKSDFGNIEFWAMGPAYYYSNLSINPVGLVPHKNEYHKNLAFYFDHGLKAYLFNNIGWSSNLKDSGEPLGSKFFQDVRTHFNAVFHNSSLNFRKHIDSTVQAGDQQLIIGNLMIDTSSAFISYWRLQEAEEIAISNNLMAGSYENIYDRYQGNIYQSLEALQKAVKDSGNFLAADIGWVTDEMPIVSSQNHDFRLTDSSAAIDRGARVFVPWSLYGVVGEWYFRLQPDKPNQLLSYDLYAQEYYTDYDYIRLGGLIPDNRLVGQGFSESDYIEGPLEDWTKKSALRFDGRREMVLPNERLVKEFTAKNRFGDVVVKADDRRTVRMQTNSFIIETVCMHEGEIDGYIASKTDGANGYAFGLTKDGRPRLVLQHDAKSVEYIGEDHLPAHVWHHLLVEVNRTDRTVTFYLNGVKSNADAKEAMFEASVSLDNKADFMVGKGFIGALDFLRLSRGTLADAETTIEELMSFQFNGPALQDFTGIRFTGSTRDIGALENPNGKGQQPIHYTPPAPREQIASISKGKNEAENSKLFLTGPERSILETDWGSLSLPKTVKAGEGATIQVTFGTESVPKNMILRIDLHAIVNGKRETSYGRAAPIKVAPGVTAPYSAELPIRSLPGLERIIAVVYVSPDGNWSNALFKVSSPIDYAGEENRKEPAKSSQATSPAPLSTTFALPGPEFKIEEKDFASVILPKSGSPGESVTLKIKINPDFVKESTLLQIDTHWFKGKTRQTNGPRRGPYKLEVGQDTILEATLPIPDKEGISAVSYVLYLSTTGSWADKTVSGSFGFTVE